MWQVRPWPCHFLSLDHRTHAQYISPAPFLMQHHAINRAIDVPHQMLYVGVSFRQAVLSRDIRLITRVSVRYGEIFHEPKASEISRHISQLTSVISALFL